MKYYVPTQLHVEVLQTIEAKNREEAKKIAESNIRNRKAIQPLGNVAMGISIERSYCSEY